MPGEATAAFSAWRPQRAGTPPPWALALLWPMVREPARLAKGLDVGLCPAWQPLGTQELPRVSDTWPRGLRDPGVSGQMPAVGVRRARAPAPISRAGIVRAREDPAGWALSQRPTHSIADG